MLRLGSFRREKLERDGRFSRFENIEDVHIPEF
jgi:hypothetical protein